MQSYVQTYFRFHTNRENFWQLWTVLQKGLNSCVRCISSLKTVWKNSGSVQFLDRLGCRGIMRNESAKILFKSFFFPAAGGHCEQFWHGQGCWPFLLSIQSPTLQGGPKDGFGEAVVACDMPEPCKFPSFDSCQKRFPWTHKEVGHAPHPVVGLVPHLHHQRQNEQLNAICVIITPNRFSRANDFCFQTSISGVSDLGNCSDAVVLPYQALHRDIQSRHRCLFP